MKKTALTFLFTLTFSVVAFAQDQIIGTWLPENGESIIEIYQEGDRYFGKIVWMKHPKDKTGKPHTDRNNPKASLRDRPMLGVNILNDLKYKGKLWEGTIYSPQKGKTINALLALESEDKLKVTGSVMGFSKDQYWTRTELPKN